MCDSQQHGAHNLGWQRLQRYTRHRQRARLQRIDFRQHDRQCYPAELWERRHRFGPRYSGYAVGCIAGRFRTIRSGWDDCRRRHGCTGQLPAAAQVGFQQCQCRHHRRGHRTCHHGWRGHLHHHGYVHQCRRQWGSRERDSDGGAFGFARASDLAYRLPGCADSIGGRSNCAVPRHRHHGYRHIGQSDQSRRCRQREDDRRRCLDFQQSIRGVNQLSNRSCLLPQRGSNRYHRYRHQS